MCHPGVMIGFQALMAVAQYQGEKAVAESTYDYKLDVQAKTVATAADAARHLYQGNADQTMQTTAAASQDIQNLSNEHMRAAARARSSAAAGGVLGVSIEDATRDFEHQYVTHHQSRLQNLSWDQAQLMANARGIEAQTRGRVEGTMFAPIAMPSPYAAIAAIGASVMDAYKMFPTHGMWGDYAQKPT